MRHSRLRERRSELLAVSVRKPSPGFQPDSLPMLVKTNQVMRAFSVENRTMKQHGDEASLSNKDVWSAIRASSRSQGRSSLEFGSPEYWREVAELRRMVDEMKLTIALHRILSSSWNRA